MKATRPVNDAVVLAAAVIETAVSWYEGNSYAYWECQYCDAKAYERGTTAKDIDAATTALDRTRRFPHDDDCVARVALKVWDSPSTDLSDKQRELLSYLTAILEAGQPTPPLRMMGEALGKSGAAICNLLAQLERKGYIVRSKNHRVIALRKVGE